MTGTGGKLVRCRHFVEQASQANMHARRDGSGLVCWFVSRSAIVSRLWGTKPKYSGSGLLAEANMREAGRHELGVLLEGVLDAVYRDCNGQREETQLSHLDLHMSVPVLAMC